MAAPTAASPATSLNGICGPEGCTRVSSVATELQSLGLVCLRAVTQPMHGPDLSTQVTLDPRRTEHQTLEALHGPFPVPKRCAGKVFSP